jgi:flagellar biosynthesis chaperone FliJ
MKQKRKKQAVNPLSGAQFEQQMASVEAYIQQHEDALQAYKGLMQEAEGESPEQQAEHEAFIALSESEIRRQKRELDYYHRAFRSRLINMGIQHRARAQGR